MNISEEKKLIEKAKTDLKWFGEVYEVYFDKIYTFVSYMTRNKEVAEDIVSQTFEKAMLNIDTFEYRGYSFGAWLYRIARNLVYDRSKSKKDNNYSAEEIYDFVSDESISLVEKIEDQEMIELIRLGLEELKEEQKEVLVLRYVEGYSIKEVCEILSKSEDSVKSLAKRGIKILKQRVIEKYEG
ncbi:MAG TPA: RNA polymerase sigma factor [Candidatus Dojkabacteria bacterium]|jgi:RNA polymerase sigma-70 factor (ECF subfamily)